MPDFELTILKVDVNHAMGSRHDDPRHGTEVTSKIFSTPQEFDVCYNNCRVLETSEGVLVYQSHDHQTVLKPSESIYVNTGFNFATDKAKYYRIKAL